MVSAHPTRAAGNHSSLNARQWKDVRQAARLARSEGVSIVMHGVKIFPSNSTLSETAGGSHQQRAQPGRKNDTVTEARSSLGAAPMDANGATQGTPKLSKKQQREETRSAARLSEYQKGKAAQQRTARWLLLFQPILRQARWMIAQEAWTGWMRSQAARLKTQLKLKGILWRAWTMQSKELKEQVKIPPHRDYPPASERVRTHLRTCSHRDVYILYRARAFAAHAPEKVNYTRHGMAWGKHNWDNHRPDNGDMSDDDDDGGGSPAVRQASTRRSREEAGLKTPTSAQKGRRKPRGHR